MRLEITKGMRSERGPLMSRSSVLLGLALISAALLAPVESQAFSGSFWRRRATAPLWPKPGGSKPPANGAPPSGGSPSCSGLGQNVFAACYYDNKDLTGLKVTRDEAAVSFSWNGSSPSPAIAPTTFSARWSGLFDFDGGSYRFGVTSDDGVRLYVDDALVIDQWNDHGSTPFTALRNLGAGRHKIVMEYYNNQGGGVARLGWTRDCPSCGTPGTAGSDAFDLGQAAIHASPGDIGSRPITTRIRSIQVRANDIILDFDKKEGAGRWPDVTPPGWDGPLQFTIWIALKIGGRWHAAGILQQWYGRTGNGGIAGDQVPRNWLYDTRWGEMRGYQPQAGEQVGFFVSAGNQRSADDKIVNERSNVVVIPFPAGDADFTF
jgi:hypothetical protein